MSWIGDTVEVAKFLAEIRKDQKQKEAFELEALVQVFLEVQRNRSLIALALHDSTSEAQQLALAGEMVRDSHHGLLVAAMNLHCSEASPSGGKKGIFWSFLGREPFIWETVERYATDTDQELPDDSRVLKDGASALRFVAVRIGMLHAIARMSEQGAGVPRSVNLRQRLRNIDKAERHLQSLLKDPLAEITGRYNAPRT